MNNRVLEQAGKFYLTVSITLGVHLLTGQERLDVYYLQEIFEAMGDNPLPDQGMPKPNGEFLVSGSFYSPDRTPVPGSEVRVRLANQEKTLYIFGPRKWEMSFPSSPQPITTMAVNYSNAFGGPDLNENPQGIGHKDGRLPCIETPSHLIGSKNDKPFPAGFSPFPPDFAQRTKWQGTYGPDYKEKYFPGYPADLDWRYFLTAPSDQWIKDFYQGNESFSISHMHPDMPAIEGRFPGFTARCFTNRNAEGATVFSELPLHIDTVWFFPEKLTGLLIFRGVTQVEDDEADSVDDLLCAYEDRTQPRRTTEYYKHILERLKGRDDFLDSLTSRDLIPEGRPCAMELLTEAVPKEEKPSPLDQNIEAKARELEKTTDGHIEKALQQTEKGMEEFDIPKENRAHIPEKAAQYSNFGEDGLDIREMLQSEPEEFVDPATEDFKNKLETIMPGVTGSRSIDPDKRDLAFAGIDDIMKAAEEYAAKKEKEANDRIAEELQNAKQLASAEEQRLNERIDEIKSSQIYRDKEQVSFLEDTRKKIRDQLKGLDEIDAESEEPEKSTLPRINADALKIGTDKIRPQIVEAMQHVQSMKHLGIEDDRTKNLEKDIKRMTEETIAVTEEQLRDAEKEFKEGYIMGAHLLEQGAAPHKENLETVREQFFTTLSQTGSAAGGDWSCIDLSYENLDGIDLNGAYLEQINLKGASLKGADLSGTILCRADLSGADFSSANLEQANIGAVHAADAVFKQASLKSSILSKGNFTGADFSKADLEDSEMIEVTFDRAVFSRSNMPGIFLISLDITGADFSGACMDTNVFLKCNIRKCSFSDSTMKNAVFADSALYAVSFDRADLSNVCFVLTEPGFRMENLSFREASLVQTNFQNLKMQNTDFTHADLQNAVLSGADLTGADFRGARAECAQFRKANLSGAMMDEISLVEGSLSKARLHNTSLKRANLYMTDFLRASISKSDFTDSNMDATLIEKWRPR